LFLSVWGYYNIQGYYQFFRPLHTCDRDYEITNHEVFTQATKIFAIHILLGKEVQMKIRIGLYANISQKELIYPQHSQQKLSSVARKLNERPRKILEYETPAEKFNLCVASTD
jgi:hypothetical protein